MSHDYLIDYNRSVQTCMDILDNARPSEGIADCSKDCRHAAKQIKDIPEPPSDHVKS